MANNMANLAMEGGDPRLSVDEGKGANGLSSMAHTLPQMRKLHDSSITFEEYNYYAEKTRAEEDQAASYDAANAGSTNILSVVFPSKSDKGVAQQEMNGEKRGSVIAATVNLSDPAKRAEITDEGTCTRASFGMQS